MPVFMITCEYVTSRPKRTRNKVCNDRNSSHSVGLQPSLAIDKRDDFATIGTSESLLVTQDIPVVQGPAYSATFSPNPGLDDGLIDFIGTSVADTINVYQRTDYFQSSPSATSSNDLNDTLQVRQSSCNCPSLAISLLESISIQLVQSTLHSVPQAIRHNKSALLRCQLLKACLIFSKKIRPHDATHNSLPENSSLIQQHCCHLDKAIHEDASFEPRE
jgi:hypothetical protein